MRKAFSLVTAIFVMVLMASVAGLVFNLSGKSIQETGTQYRKEQAALLARSYTEYAILAIQGHDMATNGCLRTIQGLINYTDVNGTIQEGGADDGSGYRVTARMRYLGLPLAIDCPSTGAMLNRGKLEPNAANFAPDLGAPSVLIDVNVRYKNPNDPRAYESATRSNVPWINYNRRTLQRL